MKKLPLGIQTFSEIRDPQENYLYVDKTKLALKMINDGKYYFLSRPRRFGKSLFLYALKDVFEGKQQLFKGLYIENRWDWQTTYPVIKISFGAGVISSKEELDLTIQELLEANERELGLQCYDNKSNKKCLGDMIYKAYDHYRQKVVVLIDECDKPILDNITHTEKAEEIRSSLNSLYSVIKENDQYIEFTFLTGVNNFSKASLFSGLNNLQDISLVKDYATVCGYTREDILKHFSDALDGVDLGKLKQWYNGYNFLGESVYNPFDILSFFHNHRDYRHYWFEMENSNLLIKVVQQNNYHALDFENVIVNGNELGSFDIDRIKLEVFLFQTGYLTIKKLKTVFNQRFYELDYPNLEASSALNNIFLNCQLQNETV